MNTSIIWIIIALGLFASLLLANFSLKKWKQLKKAEAAEIVREAEQKKRRSNLVDSIRIIAQCIIEEQVEPSEGCIRIKVLLDHVDPTLHGDEAFSIFSKMYEATEHMPTHGARKQADKQLIHKLDKERFALEALHKDEIINASKSILSYNFLISEP